MDKYTFLDLPDPDSPDPTQIDMPMNQEFCNTETLLKSCAAPPQYRELLKRTAKAIAAEGKGILAADESTGTIGKRFAGIGVENCEEKRREYRELLFTSEGNVNIDNMRLILIIISYFRICLHCCRHE